MVGREGKADEGNKEERQRSQNMPKFFHRLTPLFDLMVATLLDKMTKMCHTSQFMKDLPNNRASCNAKIRSDTVSGQWSTCNFVITMIGSLCFLVTCTKWRWNLSNYTTILVPSFPFNADHEPVKLQLRNQIFTLWSSKYARKIRSRYFFINFLRFVTV